MSNNVDEATLDVTDSIRYKTMPTTSQEETKDTGNQRIVNINAPQTTKYFNNKISTAKYNFLTFLPFFLFEQFRRYANIFFLMIAIIQQVPKVSPTGRYTTAVPLFIILSISAIKEIVEDYKRHKADESTNNSKVLVLKNDEWVETCWKDIAVGNIVRLNSGQGIPADLVLLSSSEPHGMCYIETSNLDGETNLKLRQGSPATSPLLTISQLSQLTGRVICEPPNRHLYEFYGNIDIKDGQTHSLNNDQLMLRGAVLKNTKWIFGIAVYTGRESKVMLNSTAPPLKRSSVERKTNLFILALCGLLLFLTLFTSISNILWTRANYHNAWYLGFNRLKPVNWGFMVLTCFIMFHTIIPISLQVTLEMVRFIQSYFINWDIEMFDEASNTPANARTSNLNEELGQVKYIFSDKTGTLTRNVMEFKKCSIGGKTFGTAETGDIDPALMQMIETGDSNTNLFFRALAVCHTVVPEKVQTNNIDEVLYQASSPDESALVKAARIYGYFFHTRTPSSVTYSQGGVDHEFKVLNLLEFTSTRKRMSVIVESADRRVYLFTKGADNVIYERLSAEAKHQTHTEEHLEEFAKEGLRTLCIGYCEIERANYECWASTFHEASVAIEGREKKLEVAAELIEKNLLLLGATAIEDKLQDQVPETISNLAQAGIKIWVLTGDKMETAINIGHSAKLLTETMSKITLVGESLDQTRNRLQDLIVDFGENLGKENDVGLIVAGDTLKFALDFQCCKDFLHVALSCKAVICCRVSPSQKAEIVTLVKSNIQDVVTLAIGDGANDVSMIQAAHVGVGISGLEGLQAACSSDYAIAQFKFLNRLLLVHGAWNYNRLTKLILYSFYKNVCFFVIQFWFAIYNGYSGQILFERWSIALYNVIFTAAPPLALGLFDRSCSAENSLKYPQLYTEYQKNTNFNWRVFGFWMLNSIYHSAMLYWLTVYSNSHDVMFKNGQTGSLFFLGNMIYTYVIITVCVKAGIEHAAWTWMSHLAIWGSIGAWFIYFIIYSHMFEMFGVAASMARMYQMVFGSGCFWLGLFLVPPATLTRDVAWKAIKRTLFESLRERVMQMERKNQDPGKIIPPVDKRRIIPKKLLLRNPFRKTKPEEEDPPSLNRRDNAADITRRRQLDIPDDNGDVCHTQRRSSGYAFSQEEHGVVTQSQLIREYDSTIEKPQGN